MATRKSFQNLANKLINQTFADFAFPATFTYVESSGYQQQTETNETVDKVIRLKYSLSEQSNTQIEVTDVKLIAYAQDLTQEPKADRTKVLYRGVEYDIKNVDLDTADAAYVMQARPL